MKRTNFIFIAIFIALFTYACKKSQPTLSLLVWEGYADSSFVHDFEVAHQCKVVASYMGSITARSPRFSTAHSPWC